MGDAKNNRKSTQYRGPLPDFHLQPMLGHRLVPTAEWLEANKEAIAAGTAVPPEPSDCNVEIVAVMGMAYPSRFAEQQHWKRGAADMAVIASRPFKEVKAEVDSQIDGPAPAREEAPSSAVATS